jgi:hypothetical protein
MWEGWELGVGLVGKGLGRVDKAVKKCILLRFPSGHGDARWRVSGRRFGV